MGAAASASSVVTTALHGDVLVVTIDNPPVNALGAAVRQGLLAAMQQAQADAAVAAVLLVGAGKAFIAGADIREFGKPAMPPSLPEVCRSIEDCTKPVVAVLHGAALGGGLEVALSAHYRIALPAAKLGLPEVSLGLCHGGGQPLAHGHAQRIDRRVVDCHDQDGARAGSGDNGFGGSCAHAGVSWWFQVTWYC